MTDINQGDRTGGGGKPFAHRLSREALRQFKDAPAEAKLRWLEEAVAFINRFVSEEKRERWRRLQETGRPSKAAGIKERLKKT